MAGQANPCTPTGTRPLTTADQGPPPEPITPGPPHYPENPFVLDQSLLTDQGPPLKRRALPVHTPLFRPHRTRNTPPPCPMMRPSQPERPIMTTDPLLHIALTDIHPDALPRDRLTHDPAAHDELRSSILIEGLRQPIDLFELETTPDQPLPYGLISGHRRLSVFRELERDTIPAFIRTPDSMTGLLSAMVSENEIRAQISPWEKAMLVLTCLRADHFPTPDAAIDGLFPALSRQKRSRLRGHVLAAEEFEYRFATPERLSVARLDRLAAALRAGWEDILHDAIPDRRSHTLETQWQSLVPVLAEATSPEPLSGPAPGTPGAPRRLRTLRKGLTVRRELTRTGWILRFTGPDAKSPGIIDDVLDEVERMFSPD